MSQPGQVNTLQAAVILSARAEWNTALEYFNQPAVDTSPFGDHFYLPNPEAQCLLFHGGWGKVAAAASAQYVIDRWHPRLIVNLGTCGGFEGAVNVGEVILADETVIYDIYERMGDPHAARAHFTTRIDLSYLRRPYPHAVRVGRLVSADQDIDPVMVETLKSEYGAAAADWESGAIAWTAARNSIRVLILRAVSDLVGAGGGELYDQGDFQQRARGVMLPLLRALPAWLDCAYQT